MKFLRDFSAVMAVLTVLLYPAMASGQAQKPSTSASGPKIDVTEIPPSDCGGPDRTDSIAGKVIGAAPKQIRLVIYAAACNGVIYVQPTKANPFTDINPDGTFDADIHLGQTYYVLLAKPGFKPAAEITSPPKEGGDILLVTKVHGKK